MYAKFRPFRLERPASVGEALEMFGQAGDAAFIAGGTALVTSWRSGARVPPATVISLEKVVESHVTGTSGLLQFGAGATVADLLRSPGLNPSAFRDALGQMATPQVRERATVAGNIAETAWNSTLLPALLVQGTRVEARLGSGAAEPSLEGLLAGGSAPHGVLITSLAIPVADIGRTASAGTRLGTAGGRGQLLLSAAVSVGFDPSGAPSWARLSISPFRDGPRVLELHAEREGLRDFGNRLMAVAAGFFMPPTDLAASAQYRSHLIRVATRRVLEQAVRRHLAGAVGAGAVDGVAHRGQRATGVAGHRVERDPARGPSGAPQPHRG